MLPVHILSRLPNGQCLFIDQICLLKRPRPRWKDSIPKNSPFSQKFTPQPMQNSLFLVFSSTPSAKFLSIEKRTFFIYWIYIEAGQLPTQGMLNFVIITVLSLYPVAHAHYLAVHFGLAMDLFSDRMMFTKASTFRTLLISPLVPLPPMDGPSFRHYSLPEAYEQCTTCSLCIFQGTLCWCQNNCHLFSVYCFF